MAGSPTVKKLLFAIGTLGMALSILIFVVSFQSEAIRTSESNGIVITPSTYVKSSPDEDATDLFMLHQGAKLELIDKVGDWSKIKIANGNVGWLPSGSYLVI